MLAGLKAKPSPQRREELLTEAAGHLSTAISEMEPLKKEFPPVARALGNIVDAMMKLGLAGVYIKPQETPA